MEIQIKKAISQHESLEHRLSSMEEVNPGAKKLLALLDTLSFKDACRLLQALLTEEQYKTVMGWLGETG